MSAHKRDHTRQRDYDILEQFQVYDTANRGTVSMGTFQDILEELMVSLSFHDLHALQVAYGVPGTNSVGFLDFCEAVRASSDYGDHFNDRKEIIRQLPEPRKGFFTPREESVSPPREREKPYINEWSIEQMKVMQRSGKPLRSYLAFYDVKQNGKMEVHNFKEILIGYQVLPTIEQLNYVTRKYADPVDRNLVRYKEFLEVMEAASDTKSWKKGVLDQEVDDILSDEALNDLSYLRDPGTQRDEPSSAKGVSPMHNPSDTEERIQNMGAYIDSTRKILEKTPSYNTRMSPF